MAQTVYKFKISFIYHFQKDKYGPLFHKNSKNWDTIMIIVIVVKVEWYGFTLQECIQKGEDGIAKSVDPDQTAP